MTPEAVRRLRERAGHSQSEAALALGVTIRTLSRWETGAAAPNEALLELYRQKHVAKGKR